MNALQIIPPKPVATIRRSALRFRVSDAILLLVLIGGVSMSRGEDGTASEAGAAVVLKDSRDQAGDSDKSPSVTQPAEVPAHDVSSQASSSASRDEKMSAPAQSIAPSPAPANEKNELKVGAEPRNPAADANSDTAVRAETADRSAHDRDGSRVPGELSTTTSTSVAPNKGLATKPEDARARATDAIAVRSARLARRTNKHRTEVAYRSWKAVDGVPIWAGPPPIIYGSDMGAKAPYVAAPAYASRQDWMSSAMTATWERVVGGPAVILNGGKNALYGVLDVLW